MKISAGKRKKKKKKEQYFMGPKLSPNNLLLGDMLLGR
jgi:hypothetical protein